MIRSVGPARAVAKLLFAAWTANHLGSAQPPAHAQSEPAPASAAWQAEKLTYFTLEYVEPSAGVDFYRQRGDLIIASLSDALKLPVPDNLRLRLHPTTPDYIRTQPLAYEAEGVLAHSARSGRVMDIPLDRAMAAGPPGLEAALQHALGHVLAGAAGSGHLPDMWVEGTALFVELPGPDAAAGVARLRDAWSRGNLRNWSQLAAAGATLVDPPRTYPLLQASVHFLVETHGVGAFTDFLGVVGAGAHWQAALLTTYGVDADTLEAQWRAWLPEYLSGAWSRHPLHRPDVEALSARLRTGAYAEVAAQVEPALILASQRDPASAATLANLKNAAATGARGRSNLAAAVLDLDNGDYAAAIDLALAAAADLESVGDSNGAGLARDVARQAALGRSAGRDLAWAEGAPLWLAPAARLLAHRSAAAYSALRHDHMAARAAEVARAFDRRLTPLGVAILAVGIAILGANIRARRSESAPLTP